MKVTEIPALTGLRFVAAFSVLLGHAVEFRIDLVLVSGCLLASVAIAVLAALLPARRAARLQVVKALQYE